MAALNVPYYLGWIKSATHFMMDFVSLLFDKVSHVSSSPNGSGSFILPWMDSRAVE